MFSPTASSLVLNAGVTGTLHECLVFDACRLAAVSVSSPRMEMEGHRKYGRGEARGPLRQEAA